MTERKKSVAGVLKFDSQRMSYTLDQANGKTTLVDDLVSFLLDNYFREGQPVKITVTQEVE